jgi:hypothetical protein
MVGPTGEGHLNGLHNRSHDGAAGGAGAAREVFATGSETERK